MILQDAVRLMSSVQLPDFSVSGTVTTNGYIPYIFHKNFAKLYQEKIS